MFGRAIRIVVLSSLVLILGTNLVFFTITQNGNTGNDWVIIGTAVSRPGEFKFRGFRYFMDYISTFPGLTNSMNMINYSLNLLSGQADLSHIGVLDAVVGVFNLLISPVTLFITFILDILNNLIWLFGFFIPNWI